ncbi:MAG: IS66 family insertion sequence element accessory protein TnpB [Bacteroidales bacterium]|nr:IS66 family insertion sequence element accessory protein TnpB [Bacteroidales bacterium]
MFALTKSMSYHLCSHDVDMRKGIYSLYQLVKTDMKRNPLSGEVFLFVSKNRTTIKILHWEHDGFILYQKKLEKGTFEIPRFNTSSGQYEMKWNTFVLMMEGVCIHSAQYRKRLNIDLMR